MMPTTTIHKPGRMSVEMFERLLDTHGDSPRSLDWSADGQRERFRVISGMAGLSGENYCASVLDVGCGLGHLEGYLRGRGFVGRYVGIDVSEKMIEAARRVHPPRRVPTMWDPPVFLVGDALDGAFPAADVVLSSGMLNVERGDNEAAMERLLRASFEACGIACAVNMLSTRSPRERRDDRHYYDPGWAIRMALAISPRAVLRHDYRDNDFTIYLHRQAPADPKRGRRCEIGEIAGI